MYRKYPIVHPKTGIFYTKVLLRLREAFGDGYAEGIRSKIDKVRQMAGELPKAAFGEIKYVQRSASPSKVTRGLGTDFSVGYKLGITDNEEDVQETVEGWITRLRNQVMAFAQMSVDTRFGCIFILSAEPAQLFCCDRQNRNQRS